MINLFRKPLSEVEAAQAAVETATAKCERIRTQLTDTERELVASKEAAADHAAEGHSLDDWAHDIASSEAACSALRTALERTAGELKEAQAALAEAQDAEHRAKSVATINGIVQGVDQKQQAFLSALADLVSVLKPAADINPDARSLFVFLEMAALEVPPAATAMRISLEYQARSIELKSISPRLPSAEPEPEPKAGIESRPATLTVTLMYSSKWTDPRSGLTRFGAKGWEAELLVDVAQKCVDAAVAVREHDERANKLRRERGGPPIADQNAIDLDSPDVKPPAPPEPRMILPYATPKWSPQPALNNPYQPPSWMRPNRPPNDMESF